MVTNIFIHVLHLQMMTLRHPLLPQATTRGSTIYKPQLVKTRARLSCYRPHSVTLGGVSNTNNNSQSRHKISISLATTYDCIIEWRPFVRATTRTLTLVPLTRLKPGIATCLPSITSHNSRNAPVKSILKVPPKALYTTHNQIKLPLPMRHCLALSKCCQAKFGSISLSGSLVSPGTKRLRSLYLCIYCLA